MFGSILSLLDDYQLLPHATCLLWRPDLLWLHAVSDSLIALSYYSIPLALVVFAVRRRDLRFKWVFVLFGVFIMACGTTHLMSILTLAASPVGTLGPSASTAGVPTRSWVIRWRPSIRPNP